MLSEAERLQLLKVATMPDPPAGDGTVGRRCPQRSGLWLNPAMGRDTYPVVVDGGLFFLLSWPKGG